LARAKFCILNLVYFKATQHATGPNFCSAPTANSTGSIASKGCRLHHPRPEDLERSNRSGTYIYFDEFSQRDHKLRAFDESINETSLTFSRLRLPAPCAVQYSSVWLTRSRWELRRRRWANMCRRQKATSFALTTDLNLRRVSGILKSLRVYKFPLKVNQLNR
jgi:hypothetical protein